jgi:AAA15 family ATPase/GTPase
MDPIKELMQSFKPLQLKFYFLFMFHQEEIHRLTREEKYLLSYPLALVGEAKIYRFALGNSQQIACQLQLQRQTQPGQPTCMNK